MKKVLLPVLLAVGLALAGTASAEIQPGNIPAESIQTAYPIQPGTTYTGAFQPDTATYHDLDYLAFTVANPGQTLEFTLQNKALCIPPDTYEWCPVYASILDQSNTLVGNGAGTIATYADTEYFDWTFSTPGTYYLVMESNGDEPPGNPSYAVSYRIVSSGTPAPVPSSPNPLPAAPRAPLIHLLRVAGKQHGRTVTALLSLGQRASVHASIRPRRGGRPIVTLMRSLGPGSHKLSLRLPGSYRKALTYGLSLRLFISVHGASGARRRFSPSVFVVR